MSFPKHKFVSSFGKMPSDNIIAKRFALIAMPIAYRKEPFKCHEFKAISWHTSRNREQNEEQRIENREQRTEFRESIIDHHYPCEMIDR